MAMSIKLWVITFLALSLSLFATKPMDPAYEKSVAEYRQKIEASIKSDTGWLTVAGLYWLKPGDSTFGSDPKSDLVLPGKSPAKTGTFHFDGRAVRVSATPDSPLLVNGKPPSKAPLVNDTEEKQDFVTIGDLSMYVIERGGKVGIRLKDKSSKYRQQFTRRSWYPIKPEYNITGRFIASAQPKKLQIPTVIDGVTEEHESPGDIEFSLGGKTHRVQVLKASEGRLWLIFRDKSSGKATYPAGRFLYGDLAKDGSVNFDFNRAYNPPCAFTPFATCPLPPRQNSLNVAIEAGELTYHMEP